MPSNLLLLTHLRAVWNYGGISLSLGSNNFFIALQTGFFFSSLHVFLLNRKLLFGFAENLLLGCIFRLILDINIVSPFIELLCRFILSDFRSRIFISSSNRIDWGDG
uniref:Uncharacterized protein n=1 Tax=Heterosigma akashiwo TaxID=2829 RepID=A0A7S4DF44_HETAK